jgi:hypothetical protein
LNTRPITEVCTQCALVAPNLSADCRPWLRRVYADSFRVVGETLEVDAIELSDRKESDR